MSSFYLFIFLWYINDKLLSKQFFNFQPQQIVWWESEYGRNEKFQIILKQERKTEKIEKLGNLNTYLTRRKNKKKHTHSTLWNQYIYRQTKILKTFDYVYILTILWEFHRRPSWINRRYVLVIVTFTVFEVLSNEFCASHL